LGFKRSESRDVAAIVLAAGLGTRMRSRRAKVLHRVGGEAMVVRVVRACVAAGLSPIVVVVGHQREKVEAVVRRAFPGAALKFAWQRAQRGTGHAVRVGLSRVGRAARRVVVTSGDTPLQTAATLAALATSGATLAFVSARLADATGYGRVVRDGARRGSPPVRIVEQKDATVRERRIREANMGLYGIDGAWLRAAIRGLRAENAQGEFYLTDLVEAAARAGKAVATRRVRDPREVLGVNTRDELAAIDRLARAQR
jgi:bifunctional UDP-N-acetylglucosamine pyrophosphorylase/glucosamine-1-phosphate N-acetyltransferase